jgi:hypothetical protein
MNWLIKHLWLIPAAGGGMIGRACQEQPPDYTSAI